MRITYLHQYFKTPAMSGITRSFEMARRMVKEGHEVTMITARTDGGAPTGSVAWEEIEGIRVCWISVPYDNAMGYGRRILAFAQFAFLACRQAGRIETDVVFATSTPLTIVLPGLWAKRRRKAPMVFEVRDLWPELPIAMGALNFPLAKPVARWLERTAYRNARHVVALSPGIRDGVARSGYRPERIHVVPNGCDIAMFDVPTEKGEQFRRRRPWLGGRPLVIYAGTFGRINGVDYLVDLAAVMKRIDPEIRFLAVGRGAEQEAVRERALALGVLGETFFMEDAVPKAQMPALFSAATVSTSLFIPLEEMRANSANKFFDALAAGRPVAVNYGGWQADLLAESGAGIGLDPHDVEASARRLHALLRDEGGLETAREAARVVRQRFSRDALAARLGAVLADAARNPDG